MHSSLPVIRLEVVYQLREYREIVQRYLPRAIKQLDKKINRKLPWNWPFAEKLTLNLFLPPIFWYKKFRVGKCQFEFTPTGFSRTSNSGTSSRSWSQVKAVVRMPTAYMIELKEGGAMPLPHRVFSVDARRDFEVLLSQASLGDDA